MELIAPEAAVSGALYTVHCEAYLVPFRIESGEAGVLARVRDVLPHGTERVGTTPEDAAVFAVAAGGAGWQVCRNGEVQCEAGDLEAALDLLRRELMIHVADCAPARVFVHAGVVGWKGRALLLPGTSYVGKTTLVAALVRAGATYYSDEYAVLDGQGRVHPYARALQMREPGGWEQRSLPVEELAGVAGTASLPVEMVVFSEYRRDGEWEVRGKSRGLAVLEMMQHTIGARRSPVRAMAALAAGHGGRGGVGVAAGRCEGGSGSFAAGDG